MDQLATILVVEDHSATRRFIADNLSADGYAAIEAGCLGEALTLIEAGAPDLAIVDLGLPDGDGFDLLRRVRTSDGTASQLDPEMPLIVLSGRTGELDRVRAFSRGADDYVAKPFSYPEFLGRIGALLRRMRRRSEADRLRVGALEINRISREVRVRGQRISLSNKEYALICALAVDPPRVYTRAELLRSVWGFPASVPTRTLDSHAFRLRRKLGQFGDRFVVNVWGVGYRLVDGSRQ